MTQTFIAVLAEWQANYPSALHSFDELIQLAEGKQVVVFLDYDGTLSPIVEDPDKAVISQAVSTLLECPIAPFIAPLRHCATSIHEHNLKRMHAFFRQLAIR